MWRLTGLMKEPVAKTLFRSIDPKWHSPPGWSCNQIFVAHFDGIRAWKYFPLYSFDPWLFRNPDTFTSSV